MTIDKSRGQIIAWVAIPRTGSNYLCSLLYHHPLICSYYEIFHPQYFYSGYQNDAGQIIAYLNEQYGTSFTDAGSPDLINWIHSNPQKLLSALVYFNPQNYISFKLFPEHLEPNILQSSIISNQNIIKVLVKRDLLSTFISHEIAIKTNKWDSFNTSSVKIAISLPKLEQWITWVERWYQLFEMPQDSAPETYYVLNYEDIHSYQTNLDKLAYLDRFLQDIGIQSQQEYQLPSNDQIQIMRQQDTRRDIQDKIINYQEFLQLAQERGLSQKLNL